MIVPHFDRVRAFPRGRCAFGLHNVQHILTAALRRTELLARRSRRDMTIGAACALAVPVDTGWCVQVALLMDVGICHRQVQAMFDDAISDIGLAIRLLRHDMTCVPR